MPSLFLILNPSHIVQTTKPPPDAACTSQTPKVTPLVHTQTELIPDNMSIDIEAPSAHESDTSPSASETMLPRIRLKLGLPPGTATTVSVGKTSGNPPPRAPLPAPVPIANPSPIVQETSITPDSTASHNIRLEHSLALAEKKRKPAEDKLPSNKKPKCTPTALAIPPEGNTIRNVCMRRWNKQQPGGQGLATDFDVYFKALTEAEKEPFKREMQAV
ncbi:hypothetical protein EI94DRAFT_1766954, partial [Lactarius quietus]